MNFPTIEGCYQAKKRLSNVSINTPFQYLDRISNNFNAESKFKRITTNLSYYLSNHVICNNFTQANYLKSFPFLSKKDL